MIGFILVSQLYIVQAQESGYDFSLEEDSLASLFEHLNGASTDADKLKWSGRIIEFMEDILFDYESFDYPFEKLSHLGKLKSKDENLRIYNWNILLQDGTFKYYGFLQYYHEKKDEYLLYKLEDMSDEIEKPERQVLKADNWYGALYYDIVEVKGKKHYYYTLLGWDGNNDLTTRKVVEALYFTLSGKPRFGDNVFSMIEEKYPGVKRKSVKRRLLFEYSSSANMSLRYDPDFRMIVFDHLSPTELYLKGNYQFYGPDFNHDGIEFKKGVWQHVEDLKLIDKSKTGNKTWEYKPNESFYKKR